MIELPEPIGATCTIAGIQHWSITQVLPDANLYTEDQLNQAVLDAYERAAKLCESRSANTNYRFDTREECAAAIRDELINGLGP